MGLRVVLCYGVGFYNMIPKAVLYCGVGLYNMMPKAVLDFTFMFKHAVKKHLLSKSYYTVNEFVNDKDS